MESGQALLSRPRLTSEQEHSIIVSGLTHVISGDNDQPPPPPLLGFILQQFVPRVDPDTVLPKEGLECNSQGSAQNKQMKMKRKKEIKKYKDVSWSAANIRAPVRANSGDNGSAKRFLRNGIMLNFSNEHNGYGSISRGPCDKHLKRRQKNMMATVAKNNGRGVMDEKELVEWMDSMVDNNCCGEKCSARQQELLLLQQQGRWNLLN
ncbi:hypothetical protein Drorol1_Dr00004678 [Drosera rotundifolia]